MVTTNAKLRWVPPPNWPPAPPGWSPPPGWWPPPGWPAPPAGWQWWQPCRRSLMSRVAFHAGGAVLLLAALCAAEFAIAVMAFATAACSPDPGNPVALHLGTAVIGAGATAVPAGWAYWARRRGQAAAPWWAAAAVYAAATVFVDATIGVSGCPFTF